jgi:hypothetical protein
MKHSAFGGEKIFFPKSAQDESGQIAGHKTKRAVMQKPGLDHHQHTSGFHRQFK